MNIKYKVEFDKARLPMFIMDIFHRGWSFEYIHGSFFVFVPDLKVAKNNFEKSLNYWGFQATEVLCDS
jgi:hypothetical protein